MENALEKSFLGMLIFEPCLFSSNAYFRASACYREYTVYNALMRVLISILTEIKNYIFFKRPKMRLDCIGSIFKRRMSALKKGQF